MSTGGGTANIAFLGDDNGGEQNAQAAFMTSKFWIETVQYEVNVGLITKPGPFKLTPTMPKDSTAPTPEFLITPPASVARGMPSLPKKIIIPGTQIQYSQQVNLVFGGLTWPHVSVATLVPAEPQLFTMPG